MSIMGEMR